ncbi:MAG: NUDIX domain-containing protein [bacterium]
MSRADTDELLDVLDANDRVVGTAGRGEIHRRGLCHRSVHVFLTDGQGRIYLQRRSWAKKEHPGRWDSSASGHVGTGESYGHAAARELGEELGIEAAPEPLLKVPASSETGWEHSMLYVVRGPAAGQVIVPDPEEIIEGRFFTEAEALELIRKAPDTVSPAFCLLFEAWRRQGR